MEEEWKDAIGSPLYEVSNLGKVRHKIRLTILKPRESRKGKDYICYEVHIADANKKQRNQKIHQLVANAFIPNPDNRREIDHIDRNTANNRVDNLRWCTRSENLLNTKLRSDNTSGHKRIRVYNKEKDGREGFTVKSQTGKHIGVYDTMEDAIEAYNNPNHPKRQLKPKSNTGEMNISKNGNSFTVESSKKGFECNKSFKTLEEAVVFKNSIFK